MASQLNRYDTANALLTADARRSAKALSKQRAAAQVEQERIDGVTDLILRKQDNYTVGTGSAMGHVSRVARLQQNLELINPDAAGRYALIADDHALTMVDLLAELRRGLR